MASPWQQPHLLGRICCDFVLMAPLLPYLQKLARAAPGDAPAAVYERLFSARREDVVRGLEAVQAQVREDALRWVSIFAVAWQFLRNTAQRKVTTAQTAEVLLNAEVQL